MDKETKENTTGSPIVRYFFNCQICDVTPQGQSQKNTFEVQRSLRKPRGGGVLPIMAYTGSLRPKGVPFSGFRYKKG